MDKMKHTRVKLQGQTLSEDTTSCLTSRTPFHPLAESTD